MDDDEIFYPDLTFPCPYVLNETTDGNGQVLQDICQEETDHIDMKDGRWYCSDHGAVEEVAW